MNWIETRLLRNEAREVLARQRAIMDHPAVERESLTCHDYRRVDRALEAIGQLREPANKVDVVLNGRAMTQIENGLFWAASMLERDGLRDAKDTAWRDQDLERAKDVLRAFERANAYQRN